MKKTAGNLKNNNRRIKLNQLATWLTLVANVAVLFGLVFVAVEINQNTEMMRTQIHQSRSEQAMAEAQSVFNSDYIPSLLARVKAGDSLYGEDLIRYEFVFRAFNRNWDNQLRQYNEGFLSENIPKSIRAAVQSQISESVIGRQQWSQTKFIYSNEYVDFVESVLMKKE